MQGFCQAFSRLHCSHLKETALFSYHRSHVRFSFQSPDLIMIKRGQQKQHRLQTPSAMRCIICSTELPALQHPALQLTERKLPALQPALAALGKKNRKAKIGGGLDSPECWAVQPPLTDCSSLCAGMQNLGVQIPFLTRCLLTQHPSLMHSIPYCLPDC